MTTGYVADDSHITKIKKTLQNIEPLARRQATLYDLLDVLSLHKFKEFLAEAGLLELLKQPSPLTLIAPINEAFDALNPLVLRELQGEKRLQRIQTLARAHIITGPSLFRESVNAFAIEPNYDMNGNAFDLDVTIATNAKGYAS